MILAGEVLGTFSAPKGVSGLPRPKVERLILKKGYGIEGDKFAGGKEYKTVMIVGKRPYDMAKELGIELEGGSLGENILFDFDPHEFAIGTIFQIGTAQIQITDSCTLCQHLSIFDKRLPKLVRDNRGLYCKIVSDGEVKVGDRAIWKGREV